MEVTVRFFTVLRELTGYRQIKVKLDEKATLRDLLSQISTEFGEKFAEYIFDGKGEVKSHLQFLINEKNSTGLQGLRSELREGDVIAIIPPVGGGKGIYLICRVPPLNRLDELL